MINKYITNLAHALAKIPTISKKNAENIAFFILENREIGDLIQESLTGALSSIKLCSLCNNFAQEEICRICKTRSQSKTLCIVHNIVDLVNIEKTPFNGKYHIIKGKIDPIQGINKEDLDIDRLGNRIANENIEEVILALDRDVEGNLTSEVIIQQLKGRVKISKIAVGIPSSVKVSVTDRDTLSRSLSNREEA